MLFPGRRKAETLKITNAYVNITSPGRNFVTLKIETDEGIYGLGDGTLNGRELAVASYLTDHVIPCIIGRDPFQTEDIWQYLYRGAYWRRGPVTMTAIAAVDVALWDIKGKALNTPVYNLLGGKSREGVLVYAHANGKDVDAALEDVARHKELGYKAIRVQSGIPGLSSTYGVAKGPGRYEPAERGLPHEYEWSSELYLRHVPNLFARVREEFGEEMHLLHDCHHRLTPIEAGRLGKELEPFHLFWIEDPTPAELQEGFKVIREHTTTPIAVGEVFNSVWDAHRSDSQSVDRLFAHDAGARRRNYAPEEDGGLCGDVSRSDGISWSDGFVSSDDGGGAAFRYGDSQLRNPGTHAAHGRDGRGFSAQLCVQRRDDVPGRRPGIGRGSG